MSLNAGQVYVALGGQLDTSGFRAFTSATYRAKADMEKAEHGISESHARMAKAAKLAGLAVGAAALGGAAIFAREAIKATKVAADFDQELRNLAARSDVTKKQLGQIRKAALDLGTQMGVGARQAAKAATELVKGGLSVQKLLSGGLKAALDLAVAGEMDVAEAAETMANALNAFKLPGTQAGHVADALATAANATTADVKDMAIALTQGGAAAKAAGLSFDETVAALEALALAGVKGSDAGTSLKSALTQVANPTKQAAGLMDELGLKFFDAQGNMKPLPALAGMLRDKLSGLTKEQRLQAATTLAGTDGMRALLALYDAGPKKIKALENGLKEQGTAAKVAAEQNEGAAGAGRKLAAAWEQAQIIVGTELLPAIAESADTLTAKLKEMAADGSLKKMGDDLAKLATGVAENIPAAIDGITQITDKLGGLGDVIGVLDEVISAGNWFGKLITGQWMLGLARDPFGFLLEGVKATAVALRELARGFDAIMPGDQSKMVKGLDEAVKNVDRWIERRKHEELQIAIGFEIDRSSESKLTGLFDQLNKQGKKQVALQIVTESRSAEAAIAGLQAAIKGVPSKVLLKVVADAQGAHEQVAAFTALARGVPPKTVTKVQAEAKTASAAVLAFQALARGIPPRKVLSVLANTNSARAEIAALQGMLGALPSNKTVTITTVRQTLTRQDRYPKNAKGTRTDGPELAWIGEGRDPVEWVIPRDPQYRSRALSLLMDAAKTILPGHQAGTKTGGAKPKKQRFVPPKLDPHAYSVDQFEDREHSADTALDKARQLHKNLRTAQASLRDVQRRNPRTAAQKQNKADDLKRGREKIAGIEHDLRALPENGSEARLRAILAERRKELRQAKVFQAQIAKQEQLANIARDQMELADRRDDDTLYGRAQGQRQAALNTLRGLLEQAQALAVKAGNETFAQDLTERIGQVDLGLEDAAAAMNVEETPEQKAAAEAADRLADTGMTDAERANMTRIDRDIALAALTKTLDDDKTAAGEKVAFLEQILGAAMIDPARGGDATITDLAGQLRQARDNAESLAGGTVANESADLQAQIEQERTRTRVAERERDIDRAALGAFQGFRGAGAGGLAPTIVINQQNLVPGSSDVLRRVGDAAAAGFDVQGYKRGTTVRVGP